MYFSRDWKNLWDASTCSVCYVHILKGPFLNGCQVSNDLLAV